MDQATGKRAGPLPRNPRNIWLHQGKGCQFLAKKYNLKKSADCPNGPMPPNLDVGDVIEGEGDRNGLKVQFVGVKDLPQLVGCTQRG